tara:strand:+ start:1553 stop:2437 length:885 start_codon:yes stop_codon:yes gene_type:complete
MDSKNINIPIIIFHLGNQDYVKYCLNQLQKYNNNVILLNDNPDNFKEFFNNNCKIINYKEYFINANKFIPLYKHYSSNNVQLELICIIRWMCVCEYMKNNNIKRAFICDSDVLIYDNITKINNEYLKDYDFMLCSSGSKNVTGGQSIWNFEKLEEFIKFCFNFYNDENKVLIDKWWKNYKEPGGICDMTLLYYFANNGRKFEGLRLKDFPYFKQDLTQIFNEEFTFDLHLAVNGNHMYPEEYEINESNKNKNIKFINNKPYCYNKRLNKDIRFVLLHFQGRNKSIMYNYYIQSL